MLRRATVSLYRSRQKQDRSRLQHVEQVGVIAVRFIYCQQRPSSDE